MPCLGDVQRTVDLPVAAERMLVRGHRRDRGGGRDRQDAHDDHREHEGDAVLRSPVKTLETP
jgi:hypothetical protein